MDTAEQIKARLTPDVRAFAENSFRLIVTEGRKYKQSEMDEVLFYQTVSLAYTHGRCDANEDAYTSLWSVHTKGRGVK